MLYLDFYPMLKTLCYAIFLLLTGLPFAVRAQTTPALPSFYTSYSYTGYTVFDTTSPDAPTTVRGVGGALLLRPNGTYEKHLNIVANGTPHYFNQTGGFTLAGDSIRFAFADRKGADVQRGTFRFDPATRHLTLTILGYPTGNKGVYELVAADPAVPVALPANAPAPGPARSKIKAKRRRH